MPSVTNRPVLVMGVALLHDGRVLAARRTGPGRTAGRWELPGGKVEPPESPEDAVVREELGCEVRVTGLLSGEEPIRPGLTLRVATAELVDGEPIPHEHDLVRWLAADELDQVDWLESDRPFVEQLRRRLGEGGSEMPLRAVFDLESDALSVVRRLTADGFHAEAVRERFAGEDDDEDHPWAVVTDAPRLFLDVMVDAYDGWLDEPEDHTENTGPAAVPPLDLPAEPKRVKGHFRTP